MSTVNEVHDIGNNESAAGTRKRMYRNDTYTEQNKGVAPTPSTTFETSVSDRQHTKKANSAGKVLVYGLERLELLRDNPVAFEAMEGKVYRWIERKETCINGSCYSGPECSEMLVDSDMGITVFVNGYELVLQLKTFAPNSYKKGDDKSSWKDMYCIRTSKLTQGLGLFALRNFPKMSTIGWYVGRRKWASKTQKHTPLCIPKTKEVDDSEYVPYAESERTDVDPVTVTRVSGPVSLYMGMHYMLNAESMYRKETKLPGKPIHNAVVMLDGTVQASKKIEKGDEIVCVYATNDAR